MLGPKTTNQRQNIKQSKIADKMTHKKDLK